MNDLAAVIGLEVHAQLTTRTKMFCGCETGAGGVPNTRVCPVCLGMPGALPVPNREAVRLATRAAFALSCDVRRRSVWARKSYFYPDLPKGYQITQDAEPLAVDGWVRVEDPDGTPRWIRIRRVHVEEDAGKSLHGAVRADRTGIDLNRCGHPLIEVVSEPVIETPEQARDYLERLRAVLVCCGVSTGEMESGALRCDANVSVRRPGEARGARVEIKNLNSMRFVRRALAHEIERQGRLLREGAPVEQETRRWDEAAGTTRLLRTKEDEQDYRYFADPDLPVLWLDDELVDAARRGLPELPHERFDRLSSGDGLSVDDARRLSNDHVLCAYYDRVARRSGAPRDAAAWVLGDLAGRAHEAGHAPGDALLPAERLGALVAMVVRGDVSRPAARQLLDAMLEGGEDPAVLAERLGLWQLRDTERLEALCLTSLGRREDLVKAYRGGKTSVLGYFVGDVMRASEGTADPRRVREILETMLEE